MAERHIRLVPPDVDGILWRPWPLPVHRLASLRPGLDHRALPLCQPAYAFDGGLFRVRPSARPVDTGRRRHRDPHGPLLATSRTHHRTRRCGGNDGKGRTATLKAIGGYRPAPMPPSTASSAPVI